MKNVVGYLVLLIFCGYFSPAFAQDDEVDVYAQLRQNIASACPLAWEDLAAAINTETLQDNIWQDNETDKAAFKAYLSEALSDSSPTNETLESMASDVATVATECASNRVLLLDALISKTPRDVLLAMDAVNRGLNKSIEYLDGGWTVGDVRITGRLIPQDGWVFLVGQTIGKADSQADLAGDEYMDLYELAKQWAPNSGAEDWAAGQLVTLPDMRGRTIVAANDMGGTQSDTLAEGAGVGVGTFMGSEKHTLTSQELPAHTHSVANSNPHTHSSGGKGGHDHSQYGGYGDERPRAYHATQVGEWRAQDFSRSYRTGSVGNHTHPIGSAGTHSHTVSETGSSQPHSVMQPSITFNVEMKY